MFKYAIVFAALLCLSTCNPIENEPLEEHHEIDEKEYEEFTRAMSDFLSEMLRTIEDYLHPIFELFSMLEHGEDIPHPYDSYPFDMDHIEETTDNNEVRKFEMDSVLPIPPEGFTHFLDE